MEQRHPAPGFTLIEILLIIALILILLTMVITCLRARGSFGSLGPPVPTALSIAPATATITPGAPMSFTVTVTLSAAPVAAGGPVNVAVSIAEDDWTGDDILYPSVIVSVPPGSTTGTATFSLACTVDGILAGQPDREALYDVYAEAEITGPNVTSSNAKIRCRSMTGN